MLRSSGRTQAATSLSWCESEFYALVKLTSAGLGAVSMIKDLAVDVMETTKLEKQYWKSSLMRPLVEALRYAEEPGG